MMANMTRSTSIIRPFSLQLRVFSEYLCVTP